MELNKSRVEELVGQPVSEFTVSAGCKDGDGMAGSLRSIHVKTSSGEDLHVVLKDIDKDSEAGGLQSAVEYGTFKVENTVYSTLIPLLNDFAKKRGVDANLPIPHVYSAYKGTNIVDDYLCMEDLRFQGFKMTDKFVGLTVDEMMIVANELARFHALSYAYIKWEGEKIFEGPLGVLVEFFSVDTHDLSQVNPNNTWFCAVIQQSMELARDILESQNELLHRKLKLLVQESAGASMKQEVQIGTATKTDLKYFPVIIHGDAWQNNFLFKYNNDGTPTAVRFLDFQFTRRGNIYEDLLYTIYTSTTPAFRRHHLVPVLQKYYDSFSSILKQLKTHLPIGFTFGSFLDEFKENIPFIYRYMTFAIPLQLGTSIPEVVAMMQMESSTPNGAEHSANEVESDESPVDKFLPIMRMQLQTSEKARNRLEALTQEMVDLNIF